MIKRTLCFILFPVALFTFLLGQSGEETAEPAFKIGMFDQAGVNAFIEAHEDLEGEAMDKALEKHIEALALESEAPLVFYHTTEDADPFIIASLPVEVVILNDAMGQPTPITTKAPVSLPATVKVGTVQIQDIIDQILSNESVRQMIQDQYMTLDGVSDIMEDLQFYEDILREIEEQEIPPRKVQQKYGMSKEQLAGLQAQAYQKYESSRQAFNQQFVEFYVRLILDATTQEFEEENYTHVFQFRNGPAPRLAYKQESDTIYNLTEGVAANLNTGAALSTPPSEDLESPMPVDSP